MYNEGGEKDFKIIIQPPIATGLVKFLLTFDLYPDSEVPICFLPILAIGSFGINYPLTTQINCCIIFAR